MDGRKLVGLGFRVTREWVLVRGMINVLPVDDADFALLRECHRLIGVDIKRESGISLTEALGSARWDAARTMRHLAAISA